MGLRNIGRESAKERERETTGIRVSEITPRDPEACTGSWRLSYGLEEAVGYASIKGQRSKSIFVSELFQKYQMMHDCPSHGGMLPVGDAKLLGGILHDPG